MKITLQEEKNRICELFNFEKNENFIEINKKYYIDFRNLIREAYIKMINNGISYSRANQAITDIIDMARKKVESGHMGPNDELCPTK